MRLLRRFKSQKGLTLIEMMISMVILTTVLGFSMYLIHSAHELSKDSRERLLALHAARSTLETIKNTALTSVSGISTTTFVPANLKNGAIAIATNPANVSAVSIATVTVTVSWTGARNRARSLQLSTMRSAY